MSGFPFFMNTQSFLSVTSLSEILSLLDISSEMFECIERINNTSEKYYHFKIPKKKGGFRTIHAPYSALKIIQKKFSLYLNEIYEQVKPVPVYGYVLADKKQENTSAIYQNASKHIGKKYVLNLDIAQFFPSINAYRIKNIFLNAPFCFSDEIATFLTQLSTVEKRLPEGSPSSPIISNFAFRILDYKILKISKQSNIFYTRYADDLTFSSNRKISAVFIESIKNVLAEYNFTLNADKLRCHFKLTRQTVTGLVVNEKVNIKREYLKNLRGEIYFLEKNTDKISAAEIKKIRGKLSFVKQIRGKNDALYLGLQSRFNQILKIYNPPKPKRLWKRKNVWFSPNSITSINRTDVNGTKTANINLFHQNKYVFDGNMPIHVSDVLSVISAPVCHKKMTFSKGLCSEATEKGKTIALVKQESNVIVGFINDYHISYYNTPLIINGSVNPDFKMQWLNFEEMQRNEVEMQIKLFSQLREGEYGQAKIAFGKFRFDSTNERMSVKELIELNHPEVEQIRVYQRKYVGSVPYWQGWRYKNGEWLPAGEVNNPDKGIGNYANSVEITYKNGNVQVINLNVSMAQEEENVNLFYEALVESKKGKQFFATIDAEPVNKTLKYGIEKRRGYLEVTGEPETKTYIGSSVEEFDEITGEFVNRTSKMRPIEKVGAVKDFLSKYMTSKYGKVFTLSFRYGAGNMDKELADGKYDLPKYNPKMRIIHFTKKGESAEELLAIDFSGFNKEQLLDLKAKLESVRKDSNTSLEDKLAITRVLPKINRVIVNAPKTQLMTKPNNLITHKEAYIERVRQAENVENLLTIDFSGFNLSQATNLLSKYNAALESDKYTDDELFDIVMKLSELEEYIAALPKN